MKRLPNWRARLDATLSEIRRTPFDWNGHDCATALAARAVEAITGEDLAAEYRGSFSTRLGALRLIRKLGFKTLDELIAGLLPEIPVAMAGVGDIATFASDDAFGCTLGVVNGERVFVLRPDGMGTMELLQATRAFRVG